MNMEIMDSNMRVCKRCSKTKDESQFYLKGHWVNGKYYTNFSGTCKLCILEVARLRRMGLYEKKEKQKENKEEMNWDIKLGGLTISDTQYLDGKSTSKKEKEYEYPDLWVIKNLKNYGNCFISKNISVNIRKLENKLSKNIKTRSYANGFILEVCN